MIQVKTQVVLIENEDKKEHKVNYVCFHTSIYFNDHAKLQKEII